jgi:hypothetical protein
VSAARSPSWSPHTTRAPSVGQCSCKHSPSFTTLFIQDRDKLFDQCNVFSLFLCSNSLRLLEVCGCVCVCVWIFAHMRRFVYTCVCSCAYWVTTWVEAEDFFFSVVVFTGWRSTTLALQTSWSALDSCWECATLSVSLWVSSLFLQEKKELKILCAVELVK